MTDETEDNSTGDEDDKQEDNAPELPKETKKAPTNVIVLQDDQAPPMDFDHELVENFLGVVFHRKFLEDEHICLYHEKRGHSFPSEQKTFSKKLRRSNAPARLYMGTATVSRDDEGDLRNKKDAFTRYHVLVLDDIGTKVSLDKIPKAFDPTYVIESSPGNFQYGYVLDEPLEDYEQARALIELVYGGGFSDEGGKLVNKKVRLPDGINGKQQSKDYAFRVKLHDMNGPLWSPQEILETLNIPVKWSEVEADALEVRMRNRKIIGTSPWSPINANHETLDGIIDPVFEWLADNRLVQHFDGVWATIHCPWKDSHTTGGEVAYYSPLGYGDTAENASFRGYKCFHEHGNIDKTKEFLDFVVANGGPEAGIYDPAAALVASHVYDSANNTMWDVKSAEVAKQYRGTEAFKNTHNQKITYRSCDPNNGKPKAKVTTIADMFMHSPARVVVHGATFDPGTTARLVKRYGELQVNTFSPPSWTNGPIDQSVVDPFLEFIEYLIPFKEERELFLDWLAAKAQNMAFRGWGMLMIAKMFGAGRGTLTNMLTTLFGEHNCADIPFSEMTNPTTPYNEWQGKLMVFSGEAHNTGSPEKYYQAYAKLRDVIDTTSKMVSINNKYGALVNQKLCTSHLIFSNHEDAAVISIDDRRMFVITNTHEPRSPEYFEGLNNWMEVPDTDGRPLFVQHLARWLKARKVDLKVLNGPSIMTHAKSTMVEATTSAAEILVNTIIAAASSPFTYTKLVMDIAAKFDSRISSPPDGVIRRLHRDKTIVPRGNAPFRFNGQVARVRINTKHQGALHDHITEISRRELRDNSQDRKYKREITEDLKALDIKEICIAVDLALVTAGY